MKIIYHHRTRGKGAEGAHIRGIVNALINMKHDVRILSLKDTEISYNEYTSSGEHKNQSSFYLLRILVDLTKNMPEPLFEIFELLHNLLAWIKFRNSMKYDQTDLIYERYSLFMWAGVWLAKRRGVPIILEINDSVLVSRVRNLYFKRLAKVIEQWVFQNATGLVFISAYFQKQAHSEYSQLAQSIVSPNAADTTLFCPQNYDREKLREKFGLHGKIVCGYIGGFLPWHGILRFIEKISVRIRENPDLILLLVGDGADFEKVKALVASKQLDRQIHLSGRVPHHDIPKYLVTMDFGILPDSNEYGSPMKLFEFMAMGCGMVAPDFSPIQEVIIDGQNGWLFPAKNHDACTDLVINLSKNKSYIKEVGKTARNYIVESRQWKHNVEQMFSIFQI